jgi:WD40 repeat protein
MRPYCVILLSLAVAYGCAGPSARAQGSPDVVWEAVTPSGIANSIQGVAWSPSATGVTFGSTDHWVRTRQAGNGVIVYSVLQPHRSGTADQTIYSANGMFIAVHNSSGGLGYRVHRAANGVFLGMLTVTIDANGVVQFAPDSQLSAAVAGDGTLSQWRFKDFTVIFTIGSGYQFTNTTFNFSPDAALQSEAKEGTITIRRRSDGSTVRVLTGGLLQGVTPITFTPDSSGIAAWSKTPNRVTLWRISDGVVLQTFPGTAPEEGVGNIRFTPNGIGLVTTGFFPYVDENGLWQQKGMIRFWRMADGTLRQSYGAHTGIGVTSPVAWSPDSTFFAYGTYEGTAVVARIPTEFRSNAADVGGEFSVQMLSGGNSLLRQSGMPGSTYHVEVTTNLVNWREACVLTVNSNGYCEFLDTNCHGVSLKFYRSWKSL